MDSYAINNTIDQGHAMTQSNMDYNQRVASARNQIQDTFNQTSKQDKTTQDRDKDIYELHDTIQSLSAGAKIPVLKERLNSKIKGIKNKVLKIKLHETVHCIGKFCLTEGKVTEDSAVVQLLRYYELDKELNKI